MLTLLYALVKFILREGGDIASDAFVEEKEDFIIDNAFQFLLYTRQYFRASRSSDWGGGDG